MTELSLPPLPWAPDALEPHISRTTIETHHGKHHKAYVEKANKLIAGASFETMRLEEIIIASARSGGTRELFNNAAQAWNHDFYWKSLSPVRSAPSDALTARLERDFGGVEKFKSALVAKGVSHFASGWVWLVWDDRKLAVIDTHDADNPLTHDQRAILVLDVWEHAYYLDYKNERERHLKAVVGGLLDWNGANERFEQAMK
jgi:Fe-Mn family superoxide dismutase